MVPDMGERPSRLRRLIPFLWLGLSIAWAVVIFVTDQLAWPLALWIATTVGPLTLMSSRTQNRSNQISATGHNNQGEEQ